MIIKSTTVNLADLATTKKDMYAHINDANRADAHSSNRALYNANNSLHIAKGFYQALDRLKLLELRDMVGEDIRRIEQKIISIRDEKRRRDLPKWKH